MYVSGGCGWRRQEAWSTRRYFKGHLLFHSTKMFTFGSYVNSDVCPLKRRNLPAPPRPQPVSSKPTEPQARSTPHKQHKMSGFLPDSIARWALGGGAGDNNADGGGAAESQQAAPLTEEDMRARRMARLAASEKSQSSVSDGVASDNGGAGATSSGLDNKGDESTKMDIDKPSTASTTAASATDAPQPMDVDDDDTMEPAQSKKAKTKPPSSPSTSGSTPPDPMADNQRKLRRKKMILLRKVLLVTIQNNDSDPTSSDQQLLPSCVHLTMDDDEVTSASKCPTGFQVRHIAEILAARLSLDPNSNSLRTIPMQPAGGLVGYLGGCYKRAGEEWKEIRNGMERRKDGSGGGGEELCEILEEIRKQVSLFVVLLC